MGTSDTVVKNLPAKAGNAGDANSIHGSGRSPGEGNGNLLQYSGLKNSMDRGAWRATFHGVAKELEMTEHTCTHTHTHTHTHIPSDPGYTHYQVMRCSAN